MISEMFTDGTVLILTATLAVWTVGLILDIKVKASPPVILIDMLVIAAIPVYEYFYAGFPFIDVIIVNGITFLLVFVFYYNRLGVKKAGKSLKEVEAEIAEIESGGG